MFIVSPLLPYLLRFLSPLPLPHAARPFLPRSTASSVTVRSTIRRLREQVEA